jgi:hypothetical protein
MIALSGLVVVIGLIYVAVGYRIDATRLLYAGLGATFVALVWFGSTVFELVMHRRRP